MYVWPLVSMALNKAVGLSSRFLPKYHLSNTHTPTNKHTTHGHTHIRTLTLTYTLFLLLSLSFFLFLSVFFQRQETALFPDLNGLPYRQNKLVGFDCYRQTWTWKCNENFLPFLRLICWTWWRSQKFSNADNVLWDLEKQLRGVVWW